jgi:hypothetical protein
MGQKWNVNEGEAGHQLFSCLITRTENVIL